MLTVRIGARKSRLSQVQVTEVIMALRAQYPNIDVQKNTYTTEGDRDLDTPLPVIGGKGVFTEEIECSILAGKIDLAVHSLKDLPTEPTAGLAIGAIPTRASTADALVSRDGWTIGTLPEGAVVGTSSTRRVAQLLRARPDLVPISIRGNVETRVRKLLNGDNGLDALVLAVAGLDRLGIAGVATWEIPDNIMLPAPGQGGLAVQCRDEKSWLDVLRPIDDAPTAWSTTAERAFLAGLGGGCSAPVAATARFKSGMLHLRGRILSPDGSAAIDRHTSAPVDERAGAESLGEMLATACIAGGADELLRQPV